MMNPIRFSDLSNFFRVWHRRFLPLDTDWNYDLFNSEVSQGGTSDGCKYAELLGKIWKIGDNRRIAVKNVDDRGIESLKIMEID